VAILAIGVAVIAATPSRGAAPGSHEPDTAPGYRELDQFMTCRYQAADALDDRRLLVVTVARRVAARCAHAYSALWAAENRYRLPHAFPSARQAAIDAVSGARIREFDASNPH
jgi:hypothetical protein